MKFNSMLLPVTLVAINKAKYDVCREGLYLLFDPPHARGGHSSMHRI